MVINSPHIRLHAHLPAIFIADLSGVMRIRPEKHLEKEQCRHSLLEGCLRLVVAWR